MDLLSTTSLKSTLHSNWKHRPIVTAMTLGGVVVLVIFLIWILSRIVDSGSRINTVSDGVMALAQPTTIDGGRMPMFTNGTEYGVSLWLYLNEPPRSNELSPILSIGGTPMFSIDRGTSNILVRFPTYAQVPELQAAGPGGGQDLDAQRMRQAQESQDLPRSDTREFQDLLAHAQGLVNGTAEAGAHAPAGGTDVSRDVGGAGGTTGGVHAQFDHVSMKRWVNLMAFHADGTVTLFKDGELYSVNRIGKVDVINPSGTIMVGQRPADAYMSSVVFLNHFPSDAQVKRLYRAGPQTSNSVFRLMGFNNIGVRSPVYQLTD